MWCRWTALKFKDSRRYTDRLDEATKDAEETDALVVMQGTVLGQPVVAAAFEFRFMGGSMGSVVGERFARAVKAALAGKRPLICFAASGGARMQEGLLSLMQMAKTSAALTQLSRSPAAIHLGVDRSDHGRRLRQFRHAGRRDHRRAQCADRFCRPAGDRADGAGETA